MYHSLGADDSLPVISTNEGRGESLKTVPALMEHLSTARWRAWMYPEGAHELEKELEQAFGQAVMRVVYAYLFQEGMRSKTIKMFSRGLPLWQRLLMPTLGVGLVNTMNNRLRLEGGIRSNMKIIEKTFGLVERLLSDGRAYLCGDSISAADITFAALAFPVLLPEETADVFVEYDPRLLPRGYVEVIKSLRFREGGAFALRLYRNKRTRKGSPVTPLRSSRRGRSFTLKKNVNSPLHNLSSRRGDRRATVTHPRHVELQMPLTPPKHRASFAA
ncbi:unnamed protein product [Ectocarpus sp. CCAP 1310/34]|nr:unnamed protein product [Ectocarpus sp. CCAP 1310/34]